MTSSPAPTEGSTQFLVRFTCLFVGVIGKYRLSPPFHVTSFCKCFVHILNILSSTWHGQCKCLSRLRFPDYLHEMVRERPILKYKILPQITSNRASVLPSRFVKDLEQTIFQGWSHELSRDYLFSTGRRNSSMDRFVSRSPFRFHQLVSNISTSRCKHKRTSVTSSCSWVKWRIPHSVNYFTERNELAVFGLNGSD